jgi:hypothetical protein
MLFITQCEVASKLQMWTIDDCKPDLPLSADGFQVPRSYNVVSEQLFKFIFTTNVCFDYTLTVIKELELHAPNYLVNYRQPL